MELPLPIVVDDNPYEGDFSKHNLQGFEIKSSEDLHQLEADEEKGSKIVEGSPTGAKSAKYKKKNTLSKFAKKHYMKHLGALTAEKRFKVRKSLVVNIKDLWSLIELFSARAGIVNSLYML